MKTKNIIWSIVGIVAILAAWSALLVVQTVNSVQKIAMDDLNKRDAALAQALAILDKNNTDRAFSNFQETFKFGCILSGGYFVPAKKDTNGNITTDMMCNPPSNTSSNVPSSASSTANVSTLPK